MATQWGFLVDMSRCIGCFTCAMACRNYQHTIPGVFYRQVYPLSPDFYPASRRAWLSLACNHCEHPVCLANCPANAYTKRKDGIVIHHADRCIGCRQCIRSCPFGAPHFNPVEKKVEKCSLCYERIDAKLLPACVRACPTGALRLINIMEFQDAATIRYPNGFPKIDRRINPSIRFIHAKAPLRPISPTGSPASKANPLEHAPNS